VDFHGLKSQACLLAYFGLPTCPCW